MSLFRPLLLCLCGACMAATPEQHQPSRVPYDLHRPLVRLELPAELREVSALTDVDDSTVAMVQDEEAALYFLSLASGRVLRKVPFAGPGDMEGLTRKGTDYFALRSDGQIYHLHEAGGAYALRDTIRLRLANTDIEGLALDDRTGRVLVAPKDHAKGKEGRDKRQLYAWDPSDASGRVDVVLQLSVQRLITQARAQGMHVPMRTTDKGRQVPALKLRFSSVAVHPVTGHYYLLSAVDRVLLVVEREGRLVALEQLDERLLPKAEGITFLPGGDLVIASEGEERPAMLVGFGYAP
jgi:uncharacterized protein YjiK